MKNGELTSNKGVSTDSNFAGHIAMLTTEQQLIWQRYSAMLTANAILFAFLNLSSNLPIEIITIACSSGTIICFFWIILMHVGWKIQNERCDYVKDNFPCQDGKKNPLEIYYPEIRKIEKPKRDWIRLIANLVIIVFISAYVCYYVYYKF